MGGVEGETEVPSRRPRDTWRGRRPRHLSPIALTCVILGAAALVLGALVGWRAAWLAAIVPRLRLALQPIRYDQVDIASFLGADLTVLAVIVAVLIGFNASALQTAAQTHSLALARAILLSLAPFLLFWGFTCGAALVYFFIPMTVMGQLWQIVLWFGAVVLVMLGYLWDLPWRLSGDFAVRWALGKLRHQPIERWEELDGYSTLQTGVAAAVERGDLTTLRTMASRLGAFLAGLKARGPDTNATLQAARYRALKNLVSGCARAAGSAPNVVAYHLGYVVAGVLLQGGAVDLLMADPRYDLFSGLFREIRGVPDRVDPLWSGMRHALCRRDAHGEPYLLTYWHASRAWPAGDPRRVERVAEGLFRVYANCWREVYTTWGGERATNSGRLSAPAGADREYTWHREEMGADAARLLEHFYEDLAVALPEAARRAPRWRRRHAAASVALSRELLKTFHDRVLRHWPSWAPAASRVAVEAAYKEYLGKIDTALATTIRAPRTASAADPAASPPAISSSPAE